MYSWVGFSHSRNLKLLSGTTPSGAAMTKTNTNPTGAVYTRQSSIAHSASSRLTFIVVLCCCCHGSLSLPVSPHLERVNAGEDGTTIYREISGVFMKSAVTSFTDDPPGAGGDTFCWTIRAFREGHISDSSNETCASVPTVSVNPRRSKPGQRRAQRQ
jgi:hypothetical protein